MIRFAIKNINNFDYNEREIIVTHNYKLNSIKYTYKCNVKNRVKIGILSKILKNGFLEIARFMKAKSAV